MNITLKREESDPLTQMPGDRGSWPLKVSAYEDELMTVPAKIFVYQRAGLGSSLNGDSFNCVADVMNMTEIPADAPTTDVPYFRTSVVSVVCRSQTHVLDFWTGLCDSVRTLVEEQAAADVVAVIDTITITP